MHVAQLIDRLHVGGAEKQQVLLARAAKGQEIKVTVISLHDEGPSLIRQELEAAGVPVLSFPSPTLLNMDRVRRISKLLRAQKVDLLHSHLSYANILAPLVGRLAGVPVVATLHSATLDPVHSTVIHRLEAWMLRFGARRILAVGHSIAEAHGGRFGRRAITVLPNAVPKALLLSHRARETIRAALVREPRGVLAISVGRLTESKGYPDLLHAFALVCERYDAISLLVVGDGVQRDALTSQSNALGLQGRVHFLGNRNDVPRLLAASDLFVSASHREGLPLSLLEAMAAGLPLVVTAVGEVPRLLGDDRGVMVQPHAPEALAGALQSLLNDAGQMQRYGERARAYIKRYHDLDRWFAQLIRLYEEVLTEG